MRPNAAWCVCGTGEQGSCRMNAIWQHWPFFFLGNCVWSVCSLAVASFSSFPFLLLLLFFFFCKLICLKKTPNLSPTGFSPPCVSVSSNKMKKNPDSNPLSENLEIFFRFSYCTHSVLIRPVFFSFFSDDGFLFATTDIRFKTYKH